MNEKEKIINEAKEVARELLQKAALTADTLKTKNDNGYRHEETERRIQWLENHYHIWNDEFGDVKVNIGKIGTDIFWLKRFFWIVITSTVSTLLLTLASLVARMIKG